MLDRIRTVQTDESTSKKIIYSLLIFVFGICLGLCSKALDEAVFNELPILFQRLDITNFLGRFSIWIFIAVCIAVYSSSPKRAASNVFLFFLGMVSSYYLYSALVVGFFPRTYALIWFCFTAVSPLFSFICWYAKGEGWIAVIISGVIIGVLFSQAVFLFQGIRITYVPDVIVWLASLWVFKRKPKEYIVEIAISIIVAVACQLVVPYWG